MERGGGLITHEDLAGYEAVERAPVTGTYRGYRIISMGPPSSGGVALIQLLNAVEPHPIRRMGFHSSETIHLMGEAMRRAYADRAEFQARTNRQLDLSLPMQERMRLGEEGRAYMAGLVARAQAEPGEDMLGMLVREHGDDLTTDELIGIASLLLVAGHETTANMLGLGTLALLRHPEQLAIVRDQPERVDAAVEELMRWLSIVHSGIVRVATTDTEIADQQIAAGELVICGLSAANRDPELRTDPDRLDVTRGGAGHVAFGHGVHHCLGAPLARMEMRIAYPALLRRFPGLREVPGAAHFRSFHIVYGLTSLEVTW
jgi:cytochrome P450